MSFYAQSKCIVQEIGEILIAQKKTLSVAESCTGGKISSAITSVSGSSNYFKGALIAYSNSIKINQLAVKVEDIQEHSSASEKVAMQMAEGIKNQFQTDYTIATTGYAGPKGDKVGQVFIAFASAEKAIVMECFFEGGRKEIVNKASIKALTILLSEIKK